MSSSIDTKPNGPVQADTENLFRTDHLMQNLGSRAISGGFVTMSAQGAKFLLNFLSAAILARILSPDDFGLVGMVLGITSLVEVFKDLGLSTATVQRKDITQQQVSNLFWINVALSGSFAIVSAACAPLAGSFYEDPRVTSIMLALSGGFLLTGAAVQHRALLSRQLRFRALALIDVSSNAVGFTAACIVAWIGFAHWALVAQQLITPACALVLTWSSSRWRPSAPRKNSGVRPLLHLGAHLSLADCVAMFAANCDDILLGRFFGAEPLGFYTRAQVLLWRPIQQLMMPIGSVLTPVLSRLQTDPQGYRRSFLRAYDTFALFVFCFSAMGFVLARPLVLVILGDKWNAVIPLFSAYTLVAISGPLTGVSPWLYESQARGRDQLRNHTFSSVVMILSYVVGLRWGPLGVIVAVAVSGIAVRMPIIYYLCGRSGPVSTRDLWAGFLAHLPCWGALYCTTKLAYWTVRGLPPFEQLIISGPIGLAAGIPLVLLFPRPRRSALYTLGMVHKQMSARFSRPQGAS